MEKTKRVKIVTGLKCNIQCVFCYYRDSLNAPIQSFNQVKKDLLYAKRHGITEIDFSGGEPTVHPELPKMIQEAKSIGVKRVCIISNGFRLADRGYMASLKNAGLDEILFSVHGPDEKIHDQITTIKGSFERIYVALSNAVEQGIAIRTNTVVNRINYAELSRIGSFILPFRPIQANFITINDWCFAKSLVDKLMVRYTEMSVFLKEVCDLLDKKIRAVNVRYIPFCFMEGYERFVCNQKQVQYDPFEWVPHVRARLEIQTNRARYLGILLYGYFFGGAFKKTFTLRLPELFDESVISAIRTWYYSKGENCSQCRFENICDGVENTYEKKYGFKELVPNSGNKITVPFIFREKQISFPD